MKTTVPFTYSVFCIPTEQYYYGVRHAKGCHPSDLWSKYFTSSKVIKKLIGEYGAESFIPKVRKIFVSANLAKNWEEKFLNRVNAEQSDKWINRHNGGKKFYNTGHSKETRLKMSIIFKGRIVSKDTREKLSESHKGKVMTESAKKKISDANKGKILSESTRKKISENQKGKTYSAETLKRMSEGQKGRITSDATKKKQSYANSGERSHRYGKSEEQSPVSKKWLITYPSGEQKVVVSLMAFCKRNGLHDSAMRSVALHKLKHHKLFRCDYYTEGKPIVYDKLDLTRGPRKKYIVTYPCGEKEKINSLKDFCKNNSLTYSCMNNVANNRLTSHKGFRCEHAD